MGQIRHGGSIKDFVKYTFLYGRYDTDPIIIDIAETDDHVDSTRNEYDVKAYTRSRMIIIVNWVLVMLCLISFFLMIYLIVILEKDIPHIIQNTFSLTLGYFGSAFINFLEK